MGKETGLGCRELHCRPVVTSEHIAARLKAQPGEQELPPKSPGIRPPPTHHPDNLLYRLIEEHDVDRRGNATCGSGNPVFLGQRVRGIANHEYGYAGPLADRQDRVGAGQWRTAEINNYDVGLALTDQIEETVADRGGRTRSRENALRSPGDR